MKNTILMAALVAATMVTSTATAGDIGFGAVLSINTHGEISFGPRAFTSKKAKKFVASGGVNYNFMSNSLEPVVGVGYTMKSGFVGGEIAYNLKDEKFNFGAAAGWSNAKNVPAVGAAAEEEVECPAGTTRLGDSCVEI